MQIKSVRFGRSYQLDKGQLIGQGNFAKVYKVYDDQLKRYIAIRKVVKTESDMADILKEKKINEQLQKVSSNNILEIFEIIQTQQNVWYLTEYCSGGSLWDALNEVKNHKFSELETLNCILQISKGVQELHNHRITHRDLKPENILLTKKYRKGQPIPDLKIADFGLSTKNIIMETVAGTKEYIAPQQAKFQTYTNAVDVWSIGIIFDELLHGQPFYTGQENKAVFDKIAKVDYRVRDESISEPIKQILVSILKKKAYERPIIGVLRIKLEEIMAGIINAQPRTSEPAKPAEQPKPQKIPFAMQRDHSAPKQLKEQPKAPKQQKQEPEQADVKDTKWKSQIKSVAVTMEPPDTSLGVFDLSDLRQCKIPIYKCQKKRIFQAGKKNKREQLSRLFVPIEDYYQRISEERQRMRGERLRLADFTFNPNCKITPFETNYQPFQRFTELKREFEYLNEIVYDEAYEIRILQTEHNLQKATTAIKSQIGQAREEVKELFLSQIDSYIDELVGKSIV